MRYGSYTRSFRSSRFPTAVKWLIIANLLVFLLETFVRAPFDWVTNFGLIPEMVVRGLAVWQLFTYMFLHSTAGIGHILFNMLALWMFGTDLENTWGTRRFLSFYLTCGVGAGICVLLVAYLFGNPGTAVIGASGALYGILLAYGLLFPDRTILFGLFFPIKAKYFVMIMGAIALYMSLTNTGGGVSNVAHLGGLLVGYAYLRLRFLRMDFGYFQRRLRQWKLERAKRKFQVYMKKHGKPDREPWVH